MSTGRSFSPGRFSLAQCTSRQAIGPAIRTVAQIPRTEQMSAVKHLVADALRVSREELTIEVCRLFGWNRLGSDIAATLEVAIDALVREGAIVEDGGFLRLP